MTDRVSIPRFDWERDDLRTGPWWMAVDNDAPLVCCPEGHRASISDHHVADDGTVTPSLLCPECGWHVWGRLEGWAR